MYRRIICWTPKKFNVILLLLFFGNNTVLSQVSGYVFDNTKTPIINTSVLLKNNNGNIVDYTYTDKSGHYTLDINESGFFTIVFSSLGFESLTKIIDLDSLKEKIIDVILKKKEISLDEVIIQAKKKVRISNDTITINVSSFSTGNEKVVQDLLEKLPGLIVEDDGTIKYGNKEVEKVMIEGDDFFGKGYKILTKNMPSNPLNEVEILQNYSNNNLLKNIEESDKVALNLKLKENSKRVWFGNSNLQVDPLKNEATYHLRGNLMNFGKKSKFYFLGNINNSGYNTIRDIGQLIKSSDYGGINNLGDDKINKSLINLVSFPENFKQSRININDSKLVSLNTILNLSNKTKVKILGFFNSDKKNFSKFTNNIYNFQDVFFFNKEEYSLRNNQKVFFGKFEIEHIISENKKLNGILDYSEGVSIYDSDLFFNDLTSTEFLKSNRERFNQKLTYTQKINNNSTFLITNRVINENLPENYDIKNPLFYELFTSNLNLLNSNQRVNNSMQFYGLESNLLKRNNKRDLIELKLGYQHQINKINSSLVLLNNQNVLYTPSGYQNNFKYIINDSYLSGKYLKILKKIKLSGSLSFHSLQNKIEQLNTLNEKNNFNYFNKGLNVKWLINEKSKIKIDYNYKYSISNPLDNYDGLVLINYNSFNKGLDTNELLHKKLFNVVYEYGDWSDNFFLVSSFSHVKNFDFISNNTNINQNYSIRESIIVKNQNKFTSSNRLSFYSKKLSNTFKFNLNFSRVNFQNKINDSELRSVLNLNYNYGVEIRSGFNGFFNYHLGTKWSYNLIKSINNKMSFTNNVSFVDLSFRFNDNTYLDIQNERYYFGNTLKDKSYYFIDLDFQHTLKNDRYTLGVVAQNLLNNRSFNTFSINDVGEMSTRFSLLPRYIMFRTEFRF